jgi:peroxiredoxin
VTLSIGDLAPGFELPDTQGQTASPDGAPATVLVFTCNHCPYALAWHERLAQVARDYDDRGVRFLAINPNDAER